MSMYVRRSVSENPVSVFTKVVGLQGGGDTQRLLLSVKTDVSLGNSEQDRLWRLQTREVMGSAIAHLQPAQERRQVLWMCCGQSSIAEHSATNSQSWQHRHLTWWMAAHAWQSGDSHARGPLPGGKEPAAVAEDSRLRELSIQGTETPLGGHRYLFYSLECWRSPH